jgi:hypothetical protein
MLPSYNFVQFCTIRELLYIGHKNTYFRNLHSICSICKMQTYPDIYSPSVCQNIWCVKKTSAFSPPKDHRLMQCDLCHMSLCNDCMFVYGCNGNYCVTCDPFTKKFRAVDFTNWVIERYAKKKTFHELHSEYLATLPEPATPLCPMHKNRCACITARILLSMTRSANNQ